MGIRYLTKIGTGKQTLGRYKKAGHLAKPTIIPLSNDGRIRLEFLISTSHPLSSSASIPSSQTLTLSYGEDDPSSYSQDFDINPNIYSRWGDGTYYKMSVDIKLDSKNLIITGERGHRYTFEVTWNTDYYSELFRGANQFSTHLQGVVINVPIFRFTGDTNNTPSREHEYISTSILENYLVHAIRFGYDHPQRWYHWQGEAVCSPKLVFRYKKLSDGQEMEVVHKNLRRRSGNNSTMWDTETYPTTLCGGVIGSSNIPCNSNAWIDDSNAMYWFDSDQLSTDWSDVDWEFNENGTPPMRISIEGNVSVVS